MLPSSSSLSSSFFSCVRTMVPYWRKRLFFASYGSSFMSLTGFVTLLYDAFDTLMTITIKMTITIVITNRTNKMMRILAQATVVSSAVITTKRLACARTGTLLVGIASIPTSNLRAKQVRRLATHPNIMFPSGNTFSYSFHGCTHSYRCHRSFR